ncbi:hypothetical protein DNTS_027875 [Danionella cerebrum]|uniref:GPAT/DHAPAT C-terminal domain-containing protein n=1 Tax=Danionella cerebrum TaxID=2873325 RepID=A0A553MQN4_9TELE|nr:hypothetical protein DNTS_027875 [Danionella translucida]
MNAVSGNPSSKPTVASQPSLPWGVKIRRKLKSVAPFLGRFRPLVGQCCHQCTPESLGLKLLRNTPLGFQNLTFVDDTKTGYRGWLVRRVCCLLFVWSREVYPSPTGDRWHRIRCSERLRPALVSPCSSNESDEMEVMPEVKGRLGRILALTETYVSPSLLRSEPYVEIILKAPLVYVCFRQSSFDSALICLNLFCNNLRVPYTIYPAHIQQTWLRSILQRLGVIILPEGTGLEQDPEMDSLYSSVMTSFIGELLREGADLCIGISGARGDGGQWLARVHQAISDGLLPDVCIVPVGISYDCLPWHFTHSQAGVLSALRLALFLLKGDHRGSVRIHFAQAFSLKEMCESGKCRVDGGRPLQELLMNAIIHDRMDSIYSQKDVSWLLPEAIMPELTRAHRQQSIALTLHLLYSSTRSMAVMSTSLVSCVLLHKHRKGVRVSVLCRDVCWLLEEVLFRNTDVGFGGPLVVLVHHALTLLHPYLVLAAAPPTMEPIIAPRSDPESLLTLSQQCSLITHIFIHEAVGACAVSALLSEAVGCGGGVALEFDVLLGQDELTEKSLQLIHLLAPGYIPPCQNAHSFALDILDSLVRCGVLVMEEVQTDTPVCDFMKRRGVLSWTASDNPDQSSDSECEEADPRFYKLSRPAQCPELLLFLSSLLSVQLRALCWTLESLHYLPSPIAEKDCVTQLHRHLKNQALLEKGRYESSSLDLVKMALHTFIDLGVVTEDRQREDVYLEVSPLFSQTKHKEKLLQFFRQFMFS